MEDKKNISEEDMDFKILSQEEFLKQLKEQTEEIERMYKDDEIDPKKSKEDFER